MLYQAVNTVNRTISFTHQKVHLDQEVWQWRQHWHHFIMLRAHKVFYEYSHLFNKKHKTETKKKMLGKEEVKKNHLDNDLLLMPNRYNKFTVDYKDRILSNSIQNKIKIGKYQENMKKIFFWILCSAHCVSWFR